MLIKTAKRLIAVLSAIAFLSASFLPSQSIAQDQSPIKIGGLAILSGPLSGYGKTGPMGAELAVKEINAKGGILGRKVEYIVRDDEAKPDTGVRQARRLILEDKVNFLIGVTSSAVLLAVMEIAKENKIILVGTDAATARATGEKCNKYFFRTSNNAAQDSRSAAFIMAEKPYKKWAVIAPDYEYGHSMWDNFIGTLKKLKPDVEVVAEAWPKLNAEDYSPYITQVLQAQPEAVFSALWSAGNINFVKQAKPHGFFDKIQLFAIGAGLMYEVVKTLGNEIPFDKYWGSSRYFPFAEDKLIPDTPKNREFIEAYKAAYGDYPEYLAEETYAGIYFIKAMVEKAGSLDVEALIKAGEGLSFEAPEGTKYIRPEDHQVVEDVVWGQLGPSKKYPFPTLVEYVVVPGSKATPPVEETGCKMQP
jgi:branched-chain amino acid transport system substrate-binding protein